MSTPAYQKLILGQRPSLYYRMRGSGTEGDLSPNGYTANIVNAPSLVAGAILGDSDQALSFGGNAAGQYIAPDGNPPGAKQYKPFVVGSQRSFTFWFKQTVAGSAGCPVADHLGTLALQLDSGGNNGSVLFYPNVSGTPNSVTVAPTGTFTPGVYQHWAQLVDDGAKTAQLYLNGRAVTAPVSYAPTQYQAGAGILLVGAFPAQFVTGPIDEFAVFERLVTPGEILAQAKAGGL